MFHQLPTASLCFAAVSTLLLIGTSQGTYLPPPTLNCCENSTPINGRCVCKPNYYGDSTHKCVQPCYGKCGKNEICDLFKFTCSCKPRYVKINNVCELPCGGDCIANAQCNNDTNKCECIKPFIGDASVRCYRPSTFQLKRPTYVVDEDGEFVKIQVDRIAGIFGVYEVEWKSNDVTATLDEDYEGENGTVTFANLQTTAFISIAIVDDTIDEEDETFGVTLTAVNNGGNLGTLINTVVTIKDNDLPCGGSCKRNYFCHIPSQECRCKPNFVPYNGNCEKPCFGRCCINAVCHVKEFKCQCKPGYHGEPLKRCEKPSVFALEKESYSVKEDLGILTIKVLRTVSSLGAVKVTWVATDITAVHGTDYVNHGGDLFFKDGETSKTISVVIVDDQFYEKTETFSVTLTSVTPVIAELGSPKKAVITIVDNDLACHGRCKPHAKCNTTKHQCVCETGYLGNGYIECHLPCREACLTNAYCDKSVNQCKCNKGLVGDGVEKCGPPCDNRCKNFPHSHCNYKTNKCVCDDTYHGDPYTNGCTCGTSHY